MPNTWKQISESKEAAAVLKLTLRIDEICDQHGDLPEFLPNILHQLAQLLDVGVVAVTLYRNGSDAIVLGRYEKSKDIISDETLISIASEIYGSKNWIVEKKSTRPSIQSLLAAPIYKLDKQLGSIILANKSIGEFSEYDGMVVTIVEARLDNVLDEWFQRQQQRRIILENRVIKELDRIQDASEDHGQALDEMIATVIDAVNAQIGFITLYDIEKGSHLPGGRSIRGSRPMSQENYQQVGQRIREAMESHIPVVTGHIPGTEIDGILCVPMYMSGRFLGSIVLVNKEGETGFNDSDMEIVETVAKIIDTFIFQHERYKRLVMLAGSEAARDVEEALMGRRSDTSVGQRMTITMLFADIRDYSQKTKDMDPNTAVRMLNDFFNAATPLISQYGGIVDKYVGDEIVALFTKSSHKLDHSILAVEAALGLQDELKRLNREWDLTGRPTVDIGIGIHTGDVVLGQIGSFDRKDYTAIGSNMNLTARLQSVAGAGEIIISESTYVRTTGKFMARHVGPFKIKGFGDVTAYLVEGRSPEMF